MPSSQTKTVSRRSLDNITHFSSCIGENTTFTGNFTGGDSILVLGQVMGESMDCKAVAIAESGRWDGKLNADIVIVKGTVNGDIVASEKIELLSGSKIIGNLACPVIAMENGAIHNGRIDMSTPTNIQHFEEKRDNPVNISE